MAEALALARRWELTRLADRLAEKGQEVRISSEPKI
jgi:hypothetical protein